MTRQDKKQLKEELVAFIEDYIEKDMRPVIERVSAEAAEKILEAKLSYFQKVSTATKERYLPTPPMPKTVKGTRKHAVPRGKLAGTVDSVLLELFERERRERGFSVSRMLDVVLWNYFTVNRPEPLKLSFQLSESPGMDKD
jgi:hypothetical protein